VLAIALFVVLAIILLAALWPFDFFPHNDVAWLKGRNGLDFGRNPVVLSRAPFQAGLPSVWKSGRNPPVIGARARFCRFTHPRIPNNSG